MKINRLLITAPVSDESRRRVTALLPESEVVYKDSAQVTQTDIDSIDVLFGHVNPELIADKTSLRWIQTPSAGTDHIAGFASPETIITNATGAYGPAISEHMLAMLLAAMKRLPEYYMNQKAHAWKPDGRARHIEGSTALILGLGDIGSAFARKIKALGAYTIGVRRLDASKPEYMDEVHLQDKIEELIPRADIVALSLPNNAETRHTLNAARMAKMKPGAIVINVGRGTAIDADALVEGLSAGRPSFACLDVTDPEPLPENHPLWDMENVIITPHCSGWQAAPDAPGGSTDIFIENLKAYLEDRPMRNIVDKETGYRRTILK